MPMKMRVPMATRQSLESRTRGSGADQGVRPTTGMRVALLGFALACSVAAQPNRLSDAERAQGWRLLFDGHSTAGWVEVTGKPFPANCWTVEDGSLKSLVGTDGFQDIRTVESF